MATEHTLSFLPQIGIPVIYILNCVGARQGFPFKVSLDYVSAK